MPPLVILQPAEPAPLAPPTGVAARVFTLLAHRLVNPDSDRLLQAIVEALTVGLERAGVVAYGDEQLGISAGAALNDPAVAPAWALAHAAQYTGGTLPPRLAGETEDDYLERARDAVVYPRGIRRGTHTAVRVALAPYLTGTKTVVIIDNEGGPYDLTVRTRASETPDPDAARRAIEGSHISGGPQGAIRAELVLNYVVSDAPIIDEIARAVDDIVVPIDELTPADVT